MQDRIPICVTRKNHLSSKIKKFLAQNSTVRRQVAAILDLLLRVTNGAYLHISGQLDLCAVWHAEAGNASYYGLLVKPL